MGLIQLLQEYDIIISTTDEVPKPDETLKEIKRLHNIIKMYLAAVVSRDLRTAKLSIKDVVTLTKELGNLSEMLFMFQVKLGEFEKDKMPKKSELVMEMSGQIDEQDRLKLGQNLEAKYKLIEEAEQDGKENPSNDG